MANLLFIDDESQTLELLNELYAPGNCVFVALNGKEALEIIKTKTVDVVIIDILLAGSENGYTLAQQILQNYSDIKVALMTSLSKENAEENYGTGFPILSKLDLVLTADAPGIPNVLSDFLSAGSVC